MQEAVSSFTQLSNLNPIHHDQTKVANIPFPPNSPEEEGFILYILTAVLAPYENVKLWKHKMLWETLQMLVKTRPWDLAPGIPKKFQVFPVKIERFP